MFNPLEKIQYLAVRWKVAADAPDTGDAEPGPGDTGGVPDRGGDTGGSPDGEIIGIPENLPTEPIEVVATRVINWGLGIIATITILMLVIGGFLYVTAAGDEGRIEKAKKTIKGAIIGLIFILLAAIIVNALSIALTGFGLTSN